MRYDDKYDSTSLCKVINIQIICKAVDMSHVSGPAT
jgi:hypothetical protein